MAFTDIDDMKRAIGVALPPSDWFVVEQRDVDTFADLSGDHQWIHVDPQRSEQGPYGTTIAHGLLTLSVLPRLIGQLRNVEKARMGLNCGYDRVRFTAPVPVGSRIRAHAQIREVRDMPDDAARVVTHITVELEGSDKPVCVADHVTRVYA